MNIQTTKTGITVETSPYNSRRYGKPWCAVIAFTSPSKSHFNFGEWSGADGESGDLYLNCKRTDVLAMGQKDYRNPKNSVPEFYVYNETANEWVSVSRGEAYKYFNGTGEE